MARKYSVTTEGEEALTTSLETVLQLRGSTTTRARLKAWGIAFDGTSVIAEPVRVRLLRQSTDGTATGATEVPYDEVDPAASLTSFHTFTAEPTPGNVIKEMHVHPQGGYAEQFPLGEEIVIDDATSSRLAIDVLAPAAVNVTAWMAWEE